MSEKGIQSQCVWPQVYRSRYTASRGGHAPGHLRDALIEALDSAFCDGGPWWDALQIEFYDPAKQVWWDAAKPKERAAWLIGQLWNCTDIGPGDICSELGLSSGRTFAKLVRRLKAELSESEYDFSMGRTWTSGP